MPCLIIIIVYISQCYSQLYVPYIKEFDSCILLSREIGWPSKSTPEGQNCNKKKIQGGMNTKAPYKTKRGSSLHNCFSMPHLMKTSRKSRNKHKEDELL
jgi:hypothetical protein